MVEEFYFGEETPPTEPVRRETLSNARLDMIIDRVLRTTFTEFTTIISTDDIRQLCETTTNVLKTQSSLVEIQPPLVVCGDIHGQFSDLKRIFAVEGLPSDKKYMFLGDIVDRGRQNLETAVLLLAYKARYPDKFMLLRGNHETSNINKNYGFYGEIARRYGPQHAQPIWTIFNDTFAWLPYLGLIGKKFLCMHGGIALAMQSLQQLRQLRRPLTEPPNPSLELDILWADPQPGLRGQRPSPRGASHQFGEDVVATVCQQLGVDMIIRAHQCIPSGTEYFASNRLLTIFSAPGYVGRNSGATMRVDANFVCSFNFFPAV
uniref:Serine/threonine-protein phosphatase n=1 Tax=Globodera rostochiensis TaxID=31243 RepID=A0A914HSR1_GLORO